MTYPSWHVVCLGRDTPCTTYQPGTMRVMVCLRFSSFLIWYMVKCFFWTYSYDVGHEWTNQGERPTFTSSKKIHIFVVKIFSKHQSTRTYIGWTNIPCMMLHRFNSIILTKNLKKEQQLIIVKNQQVLVLLMIDNVTEVVDVTCLIPEFYT
jgi:hypothetical protein